MGRTSGLQKYLQEQLKNPEFKKEFEKAGEDLLPLAIASEIIKARADKGITQAELAEMVGTGQPTIARLESGKYRGVSLNTLARIAHALGRKISLSLEPEIRKAA